MDSFTPDKLTADAKGVITSISRQELVNLYVVSHVEQVNARIKALSREAEEVRAECANKLTELYQSLFRLVDERVMASGEAIRAAMVSAGVQVDVVIGARYFPVKELSFGAEYISHPDPDGVYAISRQHSHKTRSPLHEVVTEALRQGHKITTVEWSADVRLFRTTAAGRPLEEVCRLELPITLTIQITEEMQDHYQRLCRLRDEVHWLKESIKDVPAMERAALAELTRRSLKSQGITLDVPLLVSGGGVR